jgi:hypothetical protein
MSGLLLLRPKRCRTSRQAYNPPSKHFPPDTPRTAITCQSGTSLYPGQFCTKKVGYDLEQCQTHADKHLAMLLRWKITYTSRDRQAYTKDMACISGVILNFYYTSTQPAGSIEKYNIDIMHSLHLYAS